MTENKHKELAWDILRCCMLWYEGAEPKDYGFDREIARLGKQLADALFRKVEELATAERLYKKYESEVNNDQ